MTADKLIEKLSLTIFAEGEQTDLSGCYIGDLLSRVISRAASGGVWVTIMNNLNVPAVALLADVPCILLAEGVQPMEGVAQKCADEGIWMLGSDRSAYELALALSEEGI